MHYKGLANQTVFIRTHQALPVKRVLIVGLGEKEEITLETIRQACAAAYHEIKNWKVKHLVVQHLSDVFEEYSVDDISQVMTEGILLASYTFGKYKKIKDRFPDLITFVTAKGKNVRLSEKGIVQGQLAAQATMFARNLGNIPGQHLTPEDLMLVAKALAKGKKNIQLKVFNQEQLQKMGAGGILSVAQGSDHPPYLVHLIYKPTKKTKKKIALVGKALTFDSGGLSLKPSEAMKNMKIDMAGAAAVLGVFSVIDHLVPRCEVHGIFAACENMPSGKALRPGDIIQVMNKKTIEVLDTDAEGRLTLADALLYASKQKPDSIIDLATLTGACVVALGEEITGVMSNDAELVARLKEATEFSGEKIWELPLEKNYRKLLKSPIADYKNIAGRWGGALTAGLFLQEFVGKIPWAHLDIAGPSFAEKTIDPYTKQGATGHGVRTLLKLISK
ncbi:MAG: putative cytosol aminopeptidase [Candidatus Uhrbacteria bacterium GW2011_GWF2_40_263]|nr:MAG: putative cytosol aminopeptidase [Candidatus Uhrbacteria bacterium GW2011_GWF2_40_263]